MDAFGALSFWGVSPALDVQQLLRTVMGPSVRPGHAHDVDAASTASDALKMLLVQPGDVRHVLKTFYTYERSINVLARHVLLLHVALDLTLPLRTRACVWLEIFGNARVQARTSAYIAAAGKVLMSLLCDEKGPEPLRSVVDFSLLTHRQRDELEDVFKSWAESVPFDIDTLRDYRLRHNYGTRYDFRNNLIDWDYQMYVKSAAGVLHFTQYREWRNSGVAFEFGDQRYDVPNRTLAGYVEGREKGASTLRRGYWGDTVASPYHALGTAAYVPTPGEAAAAGIAAAAVRGAPGGDAPPTANYAAQLFEIHSRHTGSEQWRHHAVELALYNVLSWLTEMETGQQYVMRLEHDVYSGLGDAQATSADTDAAASASVDVVDDAAAMAARVRHVAHAWRGVKLLLMTGDVEASITRSKSLQGVMDAMLLSGRSVHMLERDALPSAMRVDGGIIVVEGARNVPILKADQQVEFMKRVIGMATRAGAIVVGSDRQVSADSFAVGSVIDVGKATVDAATLKSARKDADGRPMRCFVPKCSWVEEDAVVPASKGDAKRRVKQSSMSAYSRLSRGAPDVAALLAQSPDDATAVDTASGINAEYMRGLAAHEVAGGDNPLPEAIVFACLPAAWRAKMAERVTATPPAASAAAAVVSATAAGSS